MGVLQKFAVLWKKSFELEVASEMAYRVNFIAHCVGMVFFGLLGPLLTVLIYSSTSGIPGWSFWEFILFQGTGIMVWGIGHFAMFGMVWRVMEDIRHGFFDRVLVRPFNTLGYISATAIDLDGLAPVALGAVLIGVAAVKISEITVFGVLTYIALVALALVFVYALIVIITSLAFLVVKSFGLFAIFEVTEEYSRWPITIYSSSIIFALTFIIPAGLAAFYPASALLGRLDLLMVGKLAAAAFIFLGIALVCWTVAMKKYSSAGG